jgi:hypothetical protein
MDNDELAKALDEAEDKAWSKEAQRRALRLLQAYYKGPEELMDEFDVNVEDQPTLLLGLLYTVDFLQQENALSLQKRGASITHQQLTDVMISRMEASG